VSKQEKSHRIVAGYRK